MVYGAADWDAVEKATYHAGGKPKRDVVGTDGMTLSVGNASLKIVTMPGWRSFPARASCWKSNA